MLNRARVLARGLGSGLKQPSPRYVVLPVTPPEHIVVGSLIRSFM